jgi:hypothetical protein
VQQQSASSSSRSSKQYVWWFTDASCCHSSAGDTVSGSRVPVQHAWLGVPDIMSGASQVRLGCPNGGILTCSS